MKDTTPIPTLTALLSLEYPIVTSLTTIHTEKEIFKVNYSEQGTIAIRPK